MKFGIELGGKPAEIAEVPVNQVLPLPVDEVVLVAEKEAKQGAPSDEQDKRFA